MHISLIYPAGTFFMPMISHGVEPPIDTGDDRGVEHPASNKEHYVIGQFIVSELLIWVTQSIDDQFQ
jgi:hypothetical protein